MVGNLITSYGDLCKGILASVEMLAGKQEGVETVSLDEITGFEDDVLI